LKGHGCEISMSHKSSPWENAGCESWMKALKYEEVVCCERRIFRRSGDALSEMEEDPPESACRGGLQTATSCWGQESWW
jgi:transposase InsO family protein